MWRFVGIGIAAGLFSALFGVGGGIIVVPLLILATGLESRVAAGTSLAAIGLTALFGVIAFGVLGEVEWEEAAIVGVPATVGAFAGTWFQQRVSSRVLVLAFAGLLLGIAVRLFLE